MIGIEPACTKKTGLWAPIGGNGGGKVELLSLLGGKRCLFDSEVVDGGDSVVIF